jgi:hypothetical protein
MGHSLGAGAAAIAAMELKDNDWIQVEAVGFGCPSLLSRELAASTSDFITTVVNDADVVPRMSGSSVTNLLTDLIEYDWTDKLLDDIEFSMQRAREVSGLGNLLPDADIVLKWANDFLDKEVRQKYANNKQQRRERLPSLLIPPGRCIHLFRDGYGVSAAFTPCDHFSSIEFSPTLIDDHLTMTGYYRAIISAVQDIDRDYFVSSTNKELYLSFTMRYPIIFLTCFCSII